MKKVCFFISSINLFGGTGRVCTEIANALARLDYTVTILSFHGDKPYFELHSSIKVVKLYSKKYNFKLFLPFVILKLRQKVKKIDPDILINVDSALFAYSFVSTKRLNIKNIVWEHFNFNVSLGASVRIWARRLAVKHADVIVTLTSLDKNIWEKNLDCKVPITSIPNPLPFYNEIYDPNKNKVVLSVGRLTQEKGFDRLLDVWYIVKQNATAADWQLHIVGSGELKSALENKIDALQLNSSVQLIPATSTIQDHYQDAAIYCMTSRFEGFGMVLIEAEAFGLPIVSYNCEIGPVEIIKHNHNGYLIKDGDEKSLANALLYLMDNEDERLQMGERAFNDSANYRVDVVIKRWLALFHYICTDHRAEHNKL
ncbi:glycosyltransferase family 4 protein [Mucilaginibacter robiniae]|uniref:Glycosyltransferase family 4 protein n=1 Tax=Mucilaginibacter robiniae TaxID=2728022 RepID=A0A7L5EAW7_9SPHI|nr:glycosyltransferase family 4 protein [Mucilaginibacter robiniae]QJD97536.1 glycosyltransferase family 4 protein [Mucilaginibacter robiniae]